MILESLRQRRSIRPRQELTTPLQRGLPAGKRGYDAARGSGRVARAADPRPEPLDVRLGREKISMSLAALRP